TVVSDHGYIGYAVIANRKFWEGLSADVRGQLEKAMAEATTFANGIAQTENDEALEEMKKSGKTTVTTLTPAEKESWKKALLPLYDEMASRVGKDVIAEFQKEAKSGATN